ncbi:CBS domain-containing protein [Thermococcus sp. 9N3]|uniref:CBS domain-containing protein n=1 Tax=Thermococcus sp. 9N3 TaxID=163002 RepID=UPI0014306D3C|nr:CBS domain-containing protein [Thermococcus sp. 9N3]NJE49535.1 CBS domain-containing protein [Thermococcus sp. 9N3]
MERPLRVKAKKARVLHTKKKLLKLKRKEELSHNIRYIGKVPVDIVMDRDFVRVKPTDSLAALISLLRDEESSAVVVDDSGRLVGFVTMKDILHLFAPPRHHSVVGLSLLKRYSINRATSVGDVMVTRPITVRSGDTLGHAIEVMLESGKHHLPVVDDENRVVGLLEVKDIIRLIRLVSL